MLAKVHPENVERLEALRSFKVLDTGAEKIYDDLTQLTADLCEAPICMVSLVEDDRQWFKSEVGLGVNESPIAHSVCAHAILQDSYLEIPDTHLDPRTIDNPLCQTEKPIRFYAGAILRTMDGWPLGTLCILDFKPRSLTQVQRRILEVHAKNVTRQLELTRALLDTSETLGKGSTPPLSSPKNRELFQKTRERHKTLTPREKEVMALIGGHSGSLSSKQIARKLNISHRTVDHHRSSILSKMNVDSVAELIAVSLKSGL